MSDLTTVIATKDFTVGPNKEIVIPKGAVRNVAIGFILFGLTYACNKLPVYPTKGERLKVFLFVVFLWPGALYAMFQDWYDEVI